MSIVIVTGSSGLVGAEAVLRFHSEGLHVIGIDNDMRSKFFGEAASTVHVMQRQSQLLDNFEPVNVDIRDNISLNNVFSNFGSNITGVIHCAAQPSHDWAARDPVLDFEVNAIGTLNMLEQTRKHCPEASFIFMSTNKVYGDSPNNLEFTEQATRYEVSELSPYYANGIDEYMTIDQSLHSLFGVSKASADLMVQEYGRYFGMNTVTLRGGCLTGPLHQGAELHGFLSYLVKCAVRQMPYTIFGHKGKQVRDNIHSRDLVEAFWQIYRNPRSGEVYNIGGSRFSNISMLEAISMIEKRARRKLKYTISDESRLGDHIWYVSDIRKFKNHYPEWDLTIGIEEILDEMVQRAMYEVSSE
jgi:CDP-paratose 2-epimerase